MHFHEVYLGLGGNIGDTQGILLAALKKIENLFQVRQVEVSRFYLTTPVSQIPQNPYVNAVCRFQTSLKALELWIQLQKIETELGKVPKNKDAPRIIDIDILFFGQEIYQDPDLEIPHPRWSERLFVLAPLSDLTTSITIAGKDKDSYKTTIDILKYIQEFPNINKENVILYQPLPI